MFFVISSISIPFFCTMQTLYFWQNDVAPGDATGQDVNDVWFVIDSNGTIVQTPTAQPTEPVAGPTVGAAGNAGLFSTDGTSPLLVALTLAGTIGLVFVARSAAHRR